MARYSWTSRQYLQADQRHAGAIRELALSNAWLDPANRLFERSVWNESRPQLKTLFFDSENSKKGIGRIFATVSSLSSGTADYSVAAESQGVNLAGAHDTSGAVD